MEIHIHCDSESELASHINVALEKIYQIISSNKELSKNLSFTVTEKGASTGHRGQKIKDYNGPDNSTVELLNRKHQSWVRYPAEFWEGSSAPSVHGANCAEQTVHECLKLALMDAQSNLQHIYLCMILSILHGRGQFQSIGDLAKAILDSKIYSTFDLESLQQQICNFIDAGYRYRNIRNAIGNGALFVLGQGVSRTMSVISIPRLHSLPANQLAIVWNENFQKRGRYLTRLCNISKILGSKHAARYMKISIKQS